MMAALASADFWRLSPHAQAPHGYKEWSHFSVLAPDFDLIVNFSLAERRGSVQPRLTILYCDAQGRWEGEVENVDSSAATIIAGSPDVVLGEASARLTQDGYRLEATLPRRDVSLRLDLTPLARPVVAPAIRLATADSLSWAVVPRLRADGEIVVAGHRVIAVAAPAYHDRNWGSFAWGGDYAWEWATILPDDAREPWSLVYSRITDRRRAATSAQSLILWRGETPARKFYGRDLTVAQRDTAAAAQVFRLPRFAALLGSGLAADVPRHMQIGAEAYEDKLELSLEFDRFAQVVVPNDVWPGLTALAEASGRVRVSGRIGGQRLDFQGRAQAEFNHAA